MLCWGFLFRHNTHYAHKLRFRFTSASPQRHPFSTETPFYFNHEGEDDKVDKSHRAVSRFMVKGLESEPSRIVIDKIETIPNHIQASIPQFSTRLHAALREPSNRAKHERATNRICLSSLDTLQFHQTGRTSRQRCAGLFFTHLIGSTFVKLLIWCL